MTPEEEAAKAAKDAEEQAARDAAAAAKATKDAEEQAARDAAAAERKAEREELERVRADNEKLTKEAEGLRAARTPAKKTAKKQEAEGAPPAAKRRRVSRLLGDHYYED